MDTVRRLRQACGAGSRLTRAQGMKGAVGGQDLTGRRPPGRGVLQGRALLSLWTWGVRQVDKQSVASPKSCVAGPEHTMNARRPGGEEG